MTSLSRCVVCEWSQPYPKIGHYEPLALSIGERLAVFRDQQQTVSELHRAIILGGVQHGDGWLPDECHSAGVHLATPPPTPPRYARQVERVEDVTSDALP